MADNPATKPSKSESRYGKPVKGKRSSSDPTMTQQGNKAGAKSTAAKSEATPDTQDPGPKPDLNGGTEAVPVSARHAGEREEMNSRHATALRDLHTQHEGALRDLHKQHGDERAALLTRHDSEIIPSTPKA